MKNKGLFKTIISLAWPTMLEQLMQTAVQYIDLIMVGALGTVATAAVGATTTVNWLVNSSISALGVGFLSYIAKAIGADEKEKSKMLFAREKGKAENYLKSLNFGAVHIFRPGYIYPVTQRKEPNFSYKLMRYLYKPFFSKFKTLSVTSEHLAAVMVDSAILNKGKVVFENADIIDYNIEK